MIARFHFNARLNLFGAKEIKKDMNLEKILNSINHSVFLKDASGKYIWVNDQFAKFAGVRAEKIIGLTDDDLVWSGQADYFRASNASVLSGESIVNVERTITSAEGITKIILTLSPYRSETGQIVGVLGNFFDCSQQFFVIQSNGTFQNNRFFLDFTDQWLTTEELRVLYYLFHGFTAKKIVEKTNKSLGTVGYHLDNIKNKMGCQKKDEIIEVAMRHGIFWDIISAPHQFDEQEI